MTTVKRSRGMPGALRVCSLNLREYPSPDAGQTNRLTARPPSNHVGLATDAPIDDFRRRFESMWATPDFELAGCNTHLDEVVAAGCDYPILVADLRLPTLMVAA